MAQQDGIASTAYIVRYYCQLPRCLLGLCASVCLLETTDYFEFVHFQRCYGRAGLREVGRTVEREE